MQFDENGIKSCSGFCFMLLLGRYPFNPNKTYYSGFHHCRRSNPLSRRISFLYQRTHCCYSWIIHQDNLYHSKIINTDYRLYIKLLKILFKAWSYIELYFTWGTNLNSIWRVSSCISSNMGIKVYRLWTASRREAWRICKTSFGPRRTSKGLLESKI